MHARNERRESVESTRYGSTSRRIARNRLISFANGDEKLARSYSYTKYSLRGYTVGREVSCFIGLSRKCAAGANKNLESQMRIAGRSGGGWYVKLGIE